MQPRARHASVRRRTRSSSARLRVAPRPRPAWDDSITDLASLKPSAKETLQRALAATSHNNAHAGADLRRRLGVAGAGHLFGARAAPLALRRARGRCFFPRSQRAPTGARSDRA
jgi:hypothetical protein